MIREYIYAYSAINPVDGVIDPLIAPRADTEIMAIFLQQIAERFPDEFIIMFMEKHHGIRLVSSISRIT